MIDTEKQFELLKEVLRRANKQEKQDYGKLGKKQLAILEKSTAIMKEWHSLSDNDKRSECPKDLSIGASIEWNTQCIVRNTEQISKANQLIELITEFFALEYEAKWLLLSIALRTQPSLTRYLQ